MNYPTGTPHSTRGVALLTALLVVSIVAIVAVGMASRQQLDIRRTGNVFDSDQAYLHALGVESSAQKVLLADLAKDTKAAPAGLVDSLLEDWATPLTPLDVEGGRIAGSITDVMGRFNLNNLVPPTVPPVDPPPPPDPANPVPDPAARDKDIFVRLLTAVAEVDGDEAIAMAEAVQDWIDPDVERRLNGAEDVEYLRLSPPYRTANAPLSSPSELLLVRGFTPEIYRLIAPYVTALPTNQTLININTAPAQVLAALANKTLAELEPLVKERERIPLTIEKFGVAVGVTNAPLIANKISVSSSYFLVSARAEAGRGRVQLYSLLERRTQSPTQPAPSVNVIMRGQGTF